MQYLFDSLSEIKNDLTEKTAVIFLDYDGTLTPIADTPAKAALSDETKGLLGRIAQAPGCVLGIISGRALEEIKKIIGVQNIIYAGNHGLEAEGPMIEFESPVSLRIKAVIRNIYNEALNKFGQIKGVLVEDKGLAVSIHYRLVAKDDMKVFEGILAEITEPYIVRGKIKVDAGKKVYEIKPPVEWNKGKTVLWLLARQQFKDDGQGIFPIYIGDDLADEDAFKALKSRGLTVFVGEPKGSSADYYLKEPGEVAVFLGHILAVKRGDGCRNS